MSESYYEKKDLADFSNISEFAPEIGNKFFEYYNISLESGELTEREKALIALTVAVTMNCPYCIDAYTNKCLSLGITNDEMMEAIHVGALLNDSIILSGNVMIKLKSFYGPSA